MKSFLMVLHEVTRLVQCTALSPLDNHGAPHRSSRKGALHDTSAPTRHGGRHASPRPCIGWTAASRMPSTFSRAAKRSTRPPRTLTALSAKRPPCHHNHKRHTDTVATTQPGPGVTHNYGAPSGTPEVLRGEARDWRKGAVCQSAPRIGPFLRLRASRHAARRQSCLARLRRSDETFRD
jgi:hypothetical protein